MKDIELLKKLISIPSYVEGDMNEASLGSFILDYLNSLSWLKIEKQKLINGRFNIFASDSSPTKLLLYGHMDTVTPRSHSIRNQLKPLKVGKKLFGLGAVDMKGGIASILIALKESGPTNGVGVLFSCDEEYEFLGTKKFLERYKFSPDLVLSAEATDLSIANACRGVLECTFTVEGKTAHSSTPSLGKNAIEGAIQLVDSLKVPLRKFSNKTLGRTTVNLAYLSGGVVSAKKPEKIVPRANSVPDLANLLLELRITDERITPDWLKDVLKENAKKIGLTISNFQVHFCVLPLNTKRKDLKNLEGKILKTGLPVSYLNPQNIGYYDTQLIQKAWKVPTASFGPGPRNFSHKSNEFVDLRSFKQTIQLYKHVISDYKI